MDIKTSENNEYNPSIHAYNRSHLRPTVIFNRRGHINTRGDGEETLEEKVHRDIPSAPTEKRIFAYERRGQKKKK